MPNIAEAIKQCAALSFDARIPCDVFFGEVTAVEPYKVKVGEMTLEEDILLIAEGLKPKSCEIRIAEYRREIVINEGLKVGDTVALIRKCGGTAYIAAAKL